MKKNEAKRDKKALEPIKTRKAEETEKNQRATGGMKGFFDRHKTLVESILIAVLLIMVVVTIVMSQRLEPIPDGYFYSDNDKLVLSLTADVAAFEENEEYEPFLTHVVYYNNGGDEIQDVKVFYEYESEDEAKTANDNVTIVGKNWATGKRLNGKYIMFTVKPEQYRGLTTAEVDDNISTMNAAGGLKTEEVLESEPTPEVETEPEER